MGILKRNYKKLMYIYIIVLLSVACEKKTEYEVLSGQLIGYVNLNDIDGTKMSDNSGVEITLEGSHSQVTASSEINGQYTFDNLKSGIYNIVFNKEGFCQHKIISFQFVGGNKPAITYPADFAYPTNLYRTLNIQIDSLAISILKKNYEVRLMGTAKVTCQNENSLFFTRYYLSNIPDVSYKNYISTSYQVHRTPGNEYFTFHLPIDTLKFPAGTKLYLIMYPASETGQGYIDINTGKKIYTSININMPSKIANITVPDIDTL